MLTTKTQILDKAKGGVFAGLVGGFALFSSFIGIDSQLGLEHGTFYEMIGVTVGLVGFEAIVFGFVAHMVTAAIIGAVFYVISSLHRSLYLITVPKGILAGGVTGLVVFGLFFMPIHIFVMIPVVESEIGMFIAPSWETQVGSLRTIISSTDDVFWGSMILHLLYGSVMGLFCGMMAHEEYTKIKRHTKFL